MRVSCGFLILLLASSAWADNTADEADLAFALGNRAYAQRDYDAALASYFLSYRLVPNRNVLFNIARCYEATNRLDEAYRYWNDLAVDRTLNESDRREVLQNVKRLEPKVALVSITTTPPGAELFVDREDLGSRGSTPRTVAVSPGSHEVFVRLPGYRLAMVRVKVNVGDEARRDLKLERIVGRVALTGTPVGASIRETADGKELGTLPAELEFPPGQRLLTIAAPGFLPSQVLFDVKPDVVVQNAVHLTEKPKPTGKIIVTANRDNALVRVNGKDSGFTPTVLTLAEGDYDIEVTTAEVTPFHQTVSVKPDSEQRLTVELRYLPPKIQAASKSALELDQAPASVTVVTREEIQGFGYQTLPEALRAVRGMFFTDDRIYSYAGIRGFFPPGDLNSRVLILWDGKPFNDVWAGQGYLGREFDVDLNEVDRIEVVRGPASILFGTGAFFGVINVVPRGRLDRRYVEGSLGVGGQGGVKARVTGGAAKDEQTSILLSAAGFTSTGAELTDLGAPGVVRGLDGERSIGATVRGKWNGFTLSGKWVQRRKQIPTGVSRATVGEAGTEYWDARGFAELRYDKELERVSLTGRLTYDASRYHGFFVNVDDQGVRLRSEDRGDADWFGAEARAGISLFTGNKLTVAVEGQVQLVRQSLSPELPIDARSRVLFAATLMDEWQIIPQRLFIQAGVRLDKYSDIAEFAFAPRAAIVGKPYLSGTSKLVVGRAFRAPTIYELYFTDNNVSQRAAQFLTPELITTFELEHSHDFTPELRATAGVYFNLIDRLVKLRPDPTGVATCGDAVCLQYQNAPEQLQALGAEAQLRWQPGRFTLVEGSYSFVVLRGAGTADALAYPSHLASLKGMVPIKEGYVRLSAQGTYQSARKDATTAAPLGESLLINLGLSGEYGPVRYFAGVQNLLDTRYVLPVATDAVVSAVPQYGRTFWLELTAGF